MTKDSKTEKTKLKLEALYKEYGTRTQEIAFHSARYHRNVGYVQTYLASLSSLATYIYFTQSKFFDEALPIHGGHHHLQIISALAFLTMFLFFLHATMMDTLYMLMANGSRVGVIEKKVNQTINTSAMEWENKVMPFILTDQWWVANGALRPQPLVFFWVSSLYIFAIGVLCFFAWTYARSYFGFYAVPTILLAIFHLWQWIQLSLQSGGAFIKNSIFHIFDLEDLKNWDTDVVRYIIAPLTVIFGFTVFAIASLQTATFLITEKHPFGLLSLPSVWFGDLFILPFLNRRIYDIFNVYKVSEFPTGRKFLGIVSVLGVLSFEVMAYMHYLWTQDAYTGFMDIELGRLSVAGWWHWLFSSAELTAILIAMCIGFIGIKEKDVKIIDTFLRGWILVVFFSAISFIDLCVRPIALSIFDIFCFQV